MATRRDYQMGRWLAGRLMKKTGAGQLSAAAPPVMNMSLFLTILNRTSL